MPASSYAYGGPRYSITSGDFLGKGEPQIAIAEGAGNVKTRILLFTPSGPCLYYQELGCEIEDVACMQAGGRDHLVVLARNKVLIYP
jgi:hypothetical protein